MSTNLEITSDDHLADYFHSIHTFIRNKFGLYGKAALQFFNFFFVLKVIEPYIENGSIKFDTDINCEYSKLKLITDENLKIQQVQDIKRAIYASKHKETFFMNFPMDKFSTKGSTLSEFLTKLDVLTPELMEQYHVYGRVYEYFLGHITGRNSGSRSGSQMEDLGQFFTSRHLVRYCIAKVDPPINPKNSNQIPSMGDLFCGSGGFITEYIRFLNFKYKKIDWKTNISNIYGSDTDPEIIKSARVDVMTLTGTFLSDNDVFTNNFRNINTFEENCRTDNGDKIRLDFNFTNPPYGNSGKTSSEDKLTICKAGEDIKHIANYGSINNKDYPKGIKKPTKAKPYMINGDNKETLAMLHGMGILADGGTYCGILKEGCFFDKKFGDLRKYLSTYYEVDYVISVPQDDFLNTSTKTSILIYRNTCKKTSEIKFCELTPIKIKVLGKDKIIGFNEINPQTKKSINDFICEDYKFTKQSDDYIKVGFDELEKNNFSFNFKNYIKEDITVGQGFKIVKLGDIIKYKPKTNHGAQEGEAIGKYVYYTSSQKIKYSNYLDIDNELCIIIGTGGEGALYLDDNFGMSQHMFAFNCENIHLTTYVYYYLKYNWDKLYDKCFNGSTLKCLNKTNLDFYELPIPENIETIKLYLDYLEPANQTLQTLQTLQTQKEASICGKIKLLTMVGKLGEDYDEFKFDDLIKYQKKMIKYKAESGLEKGKYKFYTSSQNKIMYINDEPMFNETMLIMGRKGDASVHYDNNFSCEHDDVYVMKVINCNIRYIYYYIKSYIDWFAYQMMGSTIKGTSKEILSKFNVRILKPDIISKYKLDDDFIFMDKLKNDIQNTLKIQEETTKQMMSMILSSTNTSTSDKEDTVIIDKETESDTDSESIISKSVKKLTKDTKPDSDSETENIVKTSKVKATKAIKPDTSPTKKKSKSVNK